MYRFGCAGGRKVIQQARHLPGGAVLKGQGGPLIAGPAAADVHLPLGQGQVRAHGGVVIRQGDQGHIHGIAEALIRGEHPVPDGHHRGHGAVLPNIGGGHTAAADGVRHGGAQRRQVPGLAGPVREVGGDVFIPGIAGVQGVLRAEIQAGGGGEHHQHHGAQDADGGQARAVALHAVDQGGNGHEVPLLIVKPGVLLQQAAQGHGAGDEQQIGGGNDHQHGGEEPGQGRQRLPDGDGQVIGPGQQQDAQHRQGPVGPGRLLPLRLAAHQLHGGGAAHPQQGGDQDQQVNGPVQAQGQEQAPGGHPVHHVRGRAHHPQQAQLRQLAQQDAQGQAPGQGDAAGEQGLPAEDPGDVPLAHAQDVIQGKLPVPAADQEGMGVKQQQQRKHPQHKAAQIQDHLHGAAAGQRSLRQPGQGHKNVEKRHGAYAGQQVRHIEAAVFPDAVPGQMAVQLHARSPPA